MWGEIYKKGLSTVIITILLIGFALVAIGIVWTIIFNIVNEESERIGANQLSLDLNFGKIDVEFPNSLNVSVKRDVGEGKIDGIKIVADDGKTSEIFSFNESIDELETKVFTLNFVDLSILNAEKLTLSPYFLTITGKEEILGVADVRNLDLFNIGSFKTGQFITNGDAEMGDTTNWVNIDGIDSEFYSGSYSFVDAGGGTIYSKELIPVDKNYLYHLEGMFKSDGIDQSRLYYGFLPYDENLKFIPPQSVDAILNTETTLYEEVHSTDTSIKLTSCNNWIILWYAVVAFDIDDSGNYNDLPNYKTSDYNISKITNYPNYCEIEIGTGYGVQHYAKFNAPAGTKVRQHQSGGTYMYTAASNSLVPFSWTNYQGDVTGMFNEGTSSTKWRKNSTYAVVLILPNYNQTYAGSPLQPRLLFDDLKLTIS
ncbi:MAG: hypothetical protein QT05_C0049G0030 [archaeon GW2011_AR13]|nr:MAG: hypothetical protein QT05_C0049G0030 [archaeon GW2011_AR13]HIG94520.1 hypothetical protein [Nanoarchaeota archaeon]HIH63043.1 hypothetical protein [Nanoarchaeota archaeon]HIJ09530.1 hypothetical protein [Nanoarchaeota archaeon]